MDKPKELPLNLRLALESVMDEYKDYALEILQLVAKRAISINPDESARFLARFIADVMSLTLVAKNEEINQRYLGQEMTLMGLEMLTSKGDSYKKMNRMFMTVLNCTAFIGDNAFDPRLYCSANDRKALRIAKNCREVYEYMRDGGNLEAITSKGKPERERFVVKLMEYYREKEK